MAEPGDQFGTWLKTKLVERRITLAQLSRAAGCDYTYLWRMMHRPGKPGRCYRRPSYQMTRRIGEALGAVEEAIAAAGFSPPEASDSARVADRLAQLEQDLAGLRSALTADPGPKVARTIPDDWKVRPVPMKGRIAAGTAGDAAELQDEVVQVPAGLVPRAEFALRVRGDSMSPTLFDGDVALLRSQTKAEPGEIVAVLLENEVTLKRYELRDGTPFLVADNDEWAPKPLSEVRGPVRIQGIVVGSIRGPEGLRRRAR